MRSGSDLSRDTTDFLANSSLISGCNSGEEETPPSSAHHHGHDFSVFASIIIGKLTKISLILSLNFLLY